ncbi:MAG: FkbM family methyltransferase [Acetobacteraceae bacterium]
MTLTGSQSNGSIRQWKRTAQAALPQWVKNWREAQYYLRYGEIELHLLEFLCASDKDAIDIGAHDGCYVHFLRRFSRHVYAYEPIPWLATELRRKFAHGVTVRADALSRSEGTGTLHIPMVKGTRVPGCATISGAAAALYDGAENIRVPVRTLDASFVGGAGFIKIDVEGHEESVLDGARGTIERCRPNLVIEAVERLAPGCVGRIATIFRDRGYDGFFQHGWSLLPVERFDAASMQREEDYPDLTATLAVRERPPRFVYNFIYLPAESSKSLLPRLGHRLAHLAAGS